ncbi:MAG: sulfatase-like hydrolase/transferase [Isosphaeraceae bacterium]|nr:sulfatase-like hydrolase/transferase [Isosphaeraceae bacterium]
MNRIKVEVALAAALGILSIAADAKAGAEASAPKPPNIVFFLADDLGWGDLGCFGSPVTRTPNLDAFARQGMKLERCYSASPVCSPSRSAILTGRTPYRNGVYTWIQEGSEVHLRTSEIALPKLLKERGYDTCHVGKWHLNGRFNAQEQPQPDTHGYDHWFATQNNAAPSHKNPVNFARNRKAVGPLEGYSGPLVVDEAIGWLAGRAEKSKPFFLSVWTHETHLPIESAPEFQKPYSELSDADLRQHRGNVSQLDHAFGKLMKALDDAGLAENTLVVFTADNGPEGDGLKGRTRGSTGGLRGRKRAVYEGGIRVPGIARFPGRVPAGTRSLVPIIGSDWFPTLLAAAGAEPPRDRVLDGANVLPVLLGETATVARARPLFWRLDMAPNDRHLALRDGDWKIIASKSLDEFELYDLGADPRETTDLSTREPERFKELKRRLIEMNAEVVAEGPDWWRRLSDNGAMPKGATAKKKKAAR